jgi:hypothetical protein
MNTFVIDHNQDGVFESSEGLGYQFKEGRWSLGMQHANDGLAHDNPAQVTLRKIAQSNVVQWVGKWVQLKDAERVYFSGFITQVHMHNDELALTIHTHLYTLGQASMRLPPQQNQRSGQLIEQVLKGVNLKPTALKGRWILGRVGQSELRQNTRFAPPQVLNIMNGNSKFAYVGDTWADGIPANTALKQIVDTESGRLFVNRQGQLTFLERHELFRRANPVQSFSGGFEAEVIIGSEVVNEHHITITPRTLGTPNQVVWRLPNVLVIPPNSEMNFGVLWQDNQQQPIGALDIQPLQTLTDYRLNSLPNGAGKDITHLVECVLINIGISAGVWLIRHKLPYEFYLIFGQVRATPLIQSLPLTIRQQNQYSIHTVGKNLKTEQLPLLDSPQQALSRAKYTVGRRGLPQAELSHVQWITPQAHTALSCELFQRVALTSQIHEHHAEYFITQEQHHMTPLQHELAWGLTSANALSCWRVARSRLRQDTRLIY